MPFSRPFICPILVAYLELQLCVYTLFFSFVFFLLFVLPFLLLLLPSITAMAFKRNKTLVCVCACLRMCTCVGLLHLFELVRSLFLFLYTMLGCAVGCAGVPCSILNCTLCGHIRRECSQIQILRTTTTTLPTMTIKSVAAVTAAVAISCRYAMTNSLLSFCIFGFSLSLSFTFSRNRSQIRHFLSACRTQPVFELTYVRIRNIIPHNMRAHNTNTHAHCTYNGVIYLQ